TCLLCPPHRSSLHPYLLHFVVFFLLMPRRPPRSTLSLHDALPIFHPTDRILSICDQQGVKLTLFFEVLEYLKIKEEWEKGNRMRSEEHTSELQSRENLVCRLLLEKKKKTI